SNPLGTESTFAPAFLRISPATLRLTILSSTKRIYSSPFSNESTIEVSPLEPLVVSGMRSDSSVSKVNQKVLPTSCLEITPISPFISLQSCLDIARPSPVPPNDFLEELSTWVKE